MIFVRPGQTKFSGELLLVLLTGRNPTSPASTAKSTIIHLSFCCKSTTLSTIPPPSRIFVTDARPNEDPIKQLGLRRLYNGTNIEQTRAYIRIHSTSYVDKILTASTWMRTHSGTSIAPPSTSNIPPTSLFGYADSDWASEIHHRRRSVSSLANAGTLLNPALSAYPTNPKSKEIP
jgi:hypothetical protein